MSPHPTSTLRVSATFSRKREKDRSGYSNKPPMSVITFLHELPLQSFPISSSSRKCEPAAMAKAQVDINL